MVNECKEKNIPGYGPVIRMHLRPESSSLMKQTKNRHKVHHKSTRIVKKKCFPIFFNAIALICFVGASYNGVVSMRVYVYICLLAGLSFH